MGDVFIYFFHFLQINQLCNNLNVRFTQQKGNYKYHELLMHANQFRASTQVDETTFVKFLIPELIATMDEFPKICK